MGSLEILSPTGVATGQHGQNDVCNPHAPLVSVQKLFGALESSCDSYSCRGRPMQPHSGVPGCLQVQIANATLAFPSETFASYIICSRQTHQTCGMFKPRPCRFQKSCRSTLTRESIEKARLFTDSRDHRWLHVMQGGSCCAMTCLHAARRKHDISASASTCRLKPSQSSILEGSRIADLLVSCFIEVFQVPVSYSYLVQIFQPAQLTG